MFARRSYRIGVFVCFALALSAAAHAVPLDPDLNAAAAPLISAVTLPPADFDLFGDSAHPAARATLSDPTFPNEHESQNPLVAFLTAVLAVGAALKILSSRVWRDFLTDVYDPPSY